MDTKEATHEREATAMRRAANRALVLLFVAFAAAMLFLVVHVLMVVKSGFRRQMRAMTIGRTS